LRYSCSVDAKPGDETLVAKHLNLNVICVTRYLQIS
jgi:hypothetical protein